MKRWASPDLVLAAALNAVGEALFPSRCIGCQRRGTPLCADCRDDLPYLTAAICARCASPRGPRGACHGCRRLSPALAWIRAPFAYDGAARSAVLTLKFRSGRYLAPLMGELLCSVLELGQTEVEVVAPVPLAPARLRERGFNQAGLLAAQVAPRLEAALLPAVLSRRDRPPQRTLGAAGRLSNLAGAFACPDRRQVVGKRVLLVDDVVTTGATLSACADTLADAGASLICAVAFARDL